MPSTSARLRAQVNIALSDEEMRTLELFAFQERRAPGQLARLVLQEWLQAMVKEQGMPPEPPKPKARVASPYARLPR